ncbi:carbohydrate esterase family 16 protein [Lanmaoa asiatica]|nr:carbohydrate esterase family 16 protein [Lanmaoa asiatica]
MLHHGLLALAASLFSVPFVSAIPWNATDYMFVFGDSYSTDGYNISAGINSPTPGYTSSNGPNWVEFLKIKPDYLSTQTFNLAYGGATIDSALVPPYLPTVLSVVDQVSEFNKYLASKPTGAQWDSTNSLFAIWIGINDIGNSVGWVGVSQCYRQHAFDVWTLEQTNITQSQFYGTLMHRLFSQVDDLYNAGARNFLFLTVPPTDRAPLFLEQGPQTRAQMDTDIVNYNTQLTQMVRDFQENYADLGSVTVFDTQPIFNTLLNEWQTFGFVNVTGYCAAYENGTPARTYQVEGCAPVSSYLWVV